MGRTAAMIAIVGLILPFFALIAIGYAAGRLARHSVDGLTWLNVFVVYLALPALLFQLVAKTPIEELASFHFIAATTLATFTMLCLGFLAARFWYGEATRPATIQALAGAYGNIGFMGPGLAIAAFGAPAAVPIALIFCFDNMLHFIAAPLMMALGGDRSGSPVSIALTALRRIVTHPFIIATLLGIAAAATGFAAPGPIDRLLQLLADAAAPCALFTMGVSIALRPLGRVPSALGSIVLAKLAIHPFVVWLLLGLVGDVDPLWVKSAILLASLPTATNVFVIAQQYGVWVERASASILATTVLSVFSVTALLFLMSVGSIPIDPFS